MYRMTPTLRYVDDPDAIEDPDDVLDQLPNHAHHFKVRSELDNLAEAGVLTHKQADQVYDNWRERRQ